MNWYKLLISQQKIAMPVMKEKEYDYMSYTDIGHGTMDNVAEEYMYVIDDNKKLFIEEATPNGHNDFTQFFGNPSGKDQLYYAQGRAEIYNDNTINVSVAFPVTYKKLELNRNLKYIENLFSNYFKAPVNVYNF
jgi:hypothetical protein